MEGLKFSIVIPYRRRLDNIRVVFQSLTEQTMDLSRFEVIVGAIEYSEEFVRLCHEFNDHLTITAVMSAGEWNVCRARNLAMRQACGQVIVILDADMAIPPRLLDRLSGEYFAQGREICVLGRAAGYDDMLTISDISSASAPPFGHYRELLSELEQNGGVVEDLRDDLDDPPLPWTLVWGGLVALEADPQPVGVLPGAALLAAAGRVRADLRRVRHRRCIVNILVFGATGALGRGIVDRALVGGHQVTAVGRTADRLASRPGLRRVVCDVLDPAAVAAVVPGHDAVVSALGQTSRRSAELHPAAAGIVSQMRAAGVHRLVWVSSHGVGDARGRSGVVFERVIAPLMVRAEFADKERQEAVVSASDLDWTIVRPARLTAGPATGSVRAAPRLRLGVRSSISRADVADFVLAELASGEHLLTAPTVVSA